MSSILWNAAALASAACVGGALLSLSAAQAQTTGTTGTSGTTGTAPSAGSTTAAGGAVGATALPTAPAVQLSAAQGIVTEATNLAQRVTQMLDDARREADVIRVTCLNEKLTQINASLRTAQGRLTTLQRTVDVEQRKHELTVLTVIGQKLQLLDQESNQCVGQDMYETGPTKITTEIDTALLPFEDDPTTPQIQTPTAPSTLGVQDASVTGMSTE